MTTTLIASLAGIAILLVLSAFFSGSETALTTTSRSRLHQLERQGNRRARTVGRLIENRERLISTVLLGNNAANILASALATSVLINLAGETGVVYATLAMTLLVLVFAEILPKTYAMRHADRTALAIAPVMHVLVFTLSPIIAALHAVIRGALWLLGENREHANGRAAVEEELRGAISLHAHEGALIKRERNMLHGILDLSEVAVGEIMIHRKNMVTINADDPPAVIVQQVLDSPHTRIPIWRNDPDEIVGVIHAKDLFRAVRPSDHEIDSLDIMIIATDPWFIPESTTLRRQLSAFRQRRAHFALVIDEYGALLGLVTLEDILEEIVGEISDKHDVILRDVMPQGDGTFLVPGTTTIRDLNRELDWSLPDDEAATIAGLIIHESQQIPQAGQKFGFHGYRFDIVQRQRNQITLLRVTPPAQPHSATGRSPPERP
jgi:Mg2+/Co2+ transporter CorB